jgi:peroxiredoxin
MSNAMTASTHFSRCVTENGMADVVTEAALPCNPQARSSAGGACGSRYRRNIARLPSSILTGRSSTIMKLIAKSFLVAAAVTAALAAHVARALEVGNPAPDFTLTDINGKTHKLSDYKGKVVVLEWNNPGCPIVQAHYEAKNMQGTQQVAAADGAVWLQINTSAPSKSADKEIAAWIKEQGATSTAYLKDTTGKVGRLYGAQTTPHMFIINKDGALAYQGAIDSGNSRDIPKATNYVKAALASIKAGKPIEKTATKAYGCAVKYPKSDT